MVGPRPPESLHQIVTSKRTKREKYQRLGDLGDKLGTLSEGSEHVTEIVKRGLQEVAERIARNKV